MAFELPKLKYNYDALEPLIDAQTVEIHYTKHHQTYINNLNKALEDHADLQDWPIEKLLTNIKELPEALQTVVKNNGGGHHNHTLYWETMASQSDSKPSGSLAQKIDSDLGGFETLKTNLIQEGVKRFGSGWSWLVLDENGLLKIYSTANQDSPLMNHHKPLLGVDVWEHAYYLKYQNKRADYLEAWFKLIDWKAVENIFENN